MPFALVGDWLSYYRVYGLASWASTALEGLAIVNAFWLVAENYPRIRKPGIALLVGLAGVGAGLLWVSGNIAPPPGWYGYWHSAILAQRTTLAIMIFMLCGARALLPRISGIPISRLAKRTADILTFHATLVMLSTLIDVLGGQERRYSAISGVLTAINGLLFGVLCVWLAWQGELLEDSGAGLSEERRRQRLKAAAAFHSTYFGLRKKAQEAASEQQESTQSSRRTT
jgi:hypothetical protein